MVDLFNPKDNNTSPGHKELIMTSLSLEPVRGRFPHFSKHALPVNS